MRATTTIELHQIETLPQFNTLGDTNIEELVISSCPNFDALSLVNLYNARSMCAVKCFIRPDQETAIATLFDLLLPQITLVRIK